MLTCSALLIPFEIAPELAESPFQSWATQHVFLKISFDKQSILYEIIGQIDRLLISNSATPKSCRITNDITCKAVAVSSAIVGLTALLLFTKSKTRS